MLMLTWPFQSVWYLQRLNNSESRCSTWQEISTPAKRFLSNSSLPIWQDFWEQQTSASHHRDSLTGQQWPPCNLYLTQKEPFLPFVEISSWIVCKVMSSDVINLASGTGFTVFSEYLLSTLWGAERLCTSNSKKKQKNNNRMTHFMPFK